MRRSANKYVVFIELEDTEIVDLHNGTDKEIVDTFVKYRRKPTIKDIKNWSIERVRYFKDQWELLWERNVRKWRMFKKT